ncbi:hypothetical protein HPB48_011789 [Haemaphysalis longicornis]|uniref:THAP-type domain-containing protein n=1 Tax=Haemaphysalis longicornis TaxID=44386 RepID=A0A9J6G6L8_HAELO|nr:hypothetical protein HPB48_011789 [Haemaphysalis longicornis]
MSGINRKSQPCAVIGCKAVYWPAVKTKHRVPQDELLRSVWLQRIGLRPSDKRKALLVCGQHFTPDNYFRSPQMATQTEADSAVLPLPAPLSMELYSVAPLPPHFQPPRASLPLLAYDTDSDGAESESDDELPAAEPDSSYHVSFDQSFVSDHAAEEATDPHKERKFIVFESKLRQLFASCQHCHEPCQVLFKVEEGSMLQVESTCHVGHTII